jgi:hypothetical protein
VVQFPPSRGALAAGTVAKGAGQVRRSIVEGSVYPHDCPSQLRGKAVSQPQAEVSTQCRGFGIGRRMLKTALERRASLAKPPETTVVEGFKILHDCRQAGQYLHALPDRDDEVKLSLAAELKKGAHYMS